MGKKKSRATYVSKGERRSVQKMPDGRSVLERELDATQALARGKRVYETIPNPNPHETNKRFIRVRREPPPRPKSDGGKTRTKQ